MSFRRPSLFNPSRRMFGNDMLIEPWIREPELPLFGTRSYECELMSSLLDILEPSALLDRMDRMISRWIGGTVRRRQMPLIRRRRPVPFRFRRIRPSIQAAPIRRRQQRVRRAQPVRQPSRVMRPRSLSVSQREPMQRQQQQQRRRQQRPRSVSVQRVSQPTWQQPQFGKQIGGGIKRQQPIGRQVPIELQFGLGRQQQTPIQRQKRQTQRVPQVQQFGGQQFGQMGKQLPIQSTGVKQQMRSTSQQRQTTKYPSLGRQVPIEPPRQQQQQQRGVSTTGIGKLSKAAEPVTGLKLPQLYRICLNTQGCNPKDIKCNVQKTATGQCNMIITGCGPYRRCYTLPNTCDHKRMKKYVTAQNMFVIECPLLEETPRCLDISTQLQMKEDCVCLKVNIPEFIDPAKVQVNLKGNDLILRFETKCTTTDCVCRVHYYNKVTLPTQTNLDMLKCTCVKGCLCIMAPIISGGKKQAKPVQPKQQQVGRQVSGFGRVEREEEEELGGAIKPEKMRHRKQLKMQREEEEEQRGLQIPQKQQKQKGVQPTTKVSERPEKAQKLKLPKPEEISIGAGEKQTRKTTPGAPVTPSTKPKQKKKPTEKPVSGAQEKQEGQQQQEVKQSGKKEKGMKKEQGGRISGAQQLHEIFASGTTEGQQEKPEMSSESTGRPVSPTKL